MNEEKTIKKMIVLGRAAPDQMKDGRETLCVGGWSQEDGFIRLYPTSIKAQLKRWNVVDVPAERNSNDTRFESWKIKDSLKDWEKIHKKVKQSGDLNNRDDRIILLNRIPKINCIEELNEQKLSLGMIIPKEILEVKLEPRKNYKDQLEIRTSLDDFFGDNILNKPEDKFKLYTKRNYPFVPRVKWLCPGPCKLVQGHHWSSIISHEVYEWFRRNMTDKDEWIKVFDNLQLMNDDFDKWFFVGNQARYRTSFMIISILRFKKQIKSKSKKISSTSLDDFF